jgi:hypothetical protein
MVGILTCPDDCSERYDGIYYVSTFLESDVRALNIAFQCRGFSRSPKNGIEKK